MKRKEFINGKVFTYDHYKVHSKETHVIPYYRFVKTNFSWNPKNKVSGWIEHVEYYEGEEMKVLNRHNCSVRQVGYKYVNCFTTIMGKICDFNLPLAECKKCFEPVYYDAEQDTIKVRENTLISL